MSKFVLDNAAVKINSVELSDHVTSVEVNTSAEEVETTAMGSTGRERIPGLRDDSFTFTMQQDFAASEVDATLWPLFDGGSTFLVEVWAEGTTTSSTNPKYSGSVIMTEYPPISGGVGDLAETSVSLPVTGKISRGTA